jgi:hypothetical protein
VLCAETADSGELLFLVISLEGIRNIPFSSHIETAHLNRRPQGIWQDTQENVKVPVA